MAFTVFTATLKSVEFTSDHGLLRGIPLSGSVWGNSDELFESPEWVAGVRNNPISQTKNTWVEGVVTVDVQPSGLTFALAGYGSQGMMYFNTDGWTSTGNDCSIPFKSTYKLPDCVRIIDVPVVWKVTAGTAANRRNVAGQDLRYLRNALPE